MFVMVSQIIDILNCLFKILFWLTTKPFVCEVILHPSKRSYSLHTPPSGGDVPCHPSWVTVYKHCQVVEMFHVTLHVFHMKGVSDMKYCKPFVSVLKPTHLSICDKYHHSMVCSSCLMTLFYSSRQSGSPHKWPVMWKMFPCHVIVMQGTLCGGRINKLGLCFASHDYLGDEWEDVCWGRHLGHQLVIAALTPWTLGDVAVMSKWVI